MEKQKIIDIVIVVIIATNFIATAGVIGYLVNEKKIAYDNAMVRSARDPHGLNSLAQDESKIPEKYKKMVIEVNDNGFANVPIPLTSNQRTTFSVSNKGSKSHSFDIDALDIHSGPIAPEESKDITIEALSGETVTYNYYSALDGSSRDKFGGLVVVK